MDEHLRHDADRQRYVWVIDGDVVATMDYREEDGRTVVHHTFTEPARRGRGIAARLVRAGLEDLRSRGATVVPTCWYVADFMDAHPEFRELRALSWARRVGRFRARVSARESPRAPR